MKIMYHSLQELHATIILVFLIDLLDAGALQSTSVTIHFHNPSNCTNTFNKRLALTLRKKMNTKHERTSLAAHNHEGNFLNTYDSLTYTS